MKLPSSTLILALALLVTPWVTADVILSEVMTSNATSLMDEDEDSPDWIELYNTDAAAINLAGYFLSDDPEDLNKWEIPAVDLAGEGHLVVFASGKDRRNPAVNLHTNFQLKNGGEYLALTLPDKTTIVDAYDPEIPQLDEDQSYGVKLASGEYVIHIFDTPTPNATNDGGTVGEEVMFSVKGSPFVGTLDLELSSRSGSKITYTTDGKAPTLFNGKTYSGPITLDKTTIITAAISRGPFNQEAFVQVTPELAAFSSNLPLVLMTADSTIGSNYEEMLIGVLEPDDGAERATIDKPFALTSRGIARTRGSSTQSFPKKSYRIEFQDVKGDDRVLKPLNMPAESDWILSGRYEEDRALIRNEFIYDLSRQVGRYAARTEYCEIYVHAGEGPVDVGDYVGAYSFMEAIKRDADRIDIDELLPEDNAEPEVSGGYIFKVDRSGPNDTTITGGTQQVRITEPSRDELSSEQRAYLTDYLNDMKASFGSSDPETGYPFYIDTGSWIDHHMLNMLMLNIDALRLSTFFYKERNGKVFAGPIWDFNISSGSRDRFGNPPRATRWDVWRGISADRGTAYFSNSTQRWWGDLFTQRDFQQTYTDRWHELRQGPLSNENIIATIDGKVAELSEAQPRNQERWPQVSPEYGGWSGEIDHFKDWITNRADWVDDELVRPPVATPTSGALAAGETVKLNGHRGTLFNKTFLYFTTNGSDPRMAGGEISDAATEYTSELSLTESVTLTVREYMPNYTPLKDGPEQQWSAPASIQFVVGTTPTSSANLVISEIMYHPAAEDMVDDDEFEFIELTNTSSTEVDWLGLNFDNGLDFQALTPLIIAAGGQAVLVSNPEAFRQRYGNVIPIAGTYIGNLRNSGERIRLVSADGSEIADFSFDDNKPWPTSADGDGFSLVLNDPSSDPSDPASWRASSTKGGSPGEPDGDPIPMPGGLTFADWIVTAVSDAASRGANADPDGDDSVNLAEFFLGTDPATADTASFTVSRNGDDLLFSYPKRADISGTTAKLQSSNDLVTWADATTIATENQPNRVTTTLAIDGANYLRLKIE